MNPALDYLLKANLFLLLFYACYWLWLRKHTFFRLNRAYLLASVLTSLVLPFIQLPQETVETIPMPVAAFSLPVSVMAPAEPTGPDWETIGFWAYGLVAAVLLFRLLLQVTGIGRLIHRSERHEVDDYTLVLPADERVPTFSFFRYLVLCRRDTQTNNTPIVAHELVHIRQWHSVDVLLLEVVQLFFWMNPVLILYKRSLQQVHEFLADAQAEDKHEYAHFLVTYAFGVHPNTLTNGFFKPSLIKERIIMLQRRATNRWALGKYVLVLPLLLGLLAMTTARKEIREEISQFVTPVADEKITVSGKVTDPDGRPLPGATVVVLNGTIGAQTDAQGRYEVKVPTDVTLVASFVGFESQKKAVSGQKTLNFTLAVAVKSLQPVVVMGYEASPKPATGSAAQPAGNAPSFTVVEQSPEFPGGMAAMGNYLAQNIRYPTEARQSHTQGTVFVQFTVGTTGDITNLRVKKGIGSGCDEEAVRVVSQMPRWKPGIQNGQTVSTQYVLPIQFELEKGPKEDKRTGQVEPGKANPSLQLSLPPGDRPVFIVDGKKLAATENLATSIAPNDIASINVLKGASATSLYGQEGQNGVIEVTTRQQAMSKTIWQASQPDTDGKPTVYMLDDKVITREEFQKLDPKRIQSVEVDHARPTSTIKATSKK